MKQLSLNLLLWLNYILVILYISWISGSKATSFVETALPLLIASFMMIDVTYISACNIHENKVISLFCGLLALDCWYLLLLPDTGALSQFAFTALSPVIWYTSIKFILMFLFQGSGYKFQKITNAVLLITCVAALVGIGISNRIYALFYDIQFLLGWLCLLLISLYHWRRTVFVLKSEQKSILFSIVVTAVAFLVYCRVTVEMPHRMSNFGIYIPALLFCMSVHGIVLKEPHRYPLSTVFNRGQTVFFLGVSLVLLGLTTLSANGTPNDLYIAVNTLFSLIYLCNIMVGYALKNGRNNLINQGKYDAVLQQIQKEEALKTDFANFLHDNVLQDILSVKICSQKHTGPRYKISSRRHLTISAQPSGNRCRTTIP